MVIWSSYVFIAIILKHTIVSLIYHKKTFQALGIYPIISQLNQNILKERERVLGIKFPKSIFELFSIPGIAEIFRTRSNDDELIDNNIFDELEKLKFFGEIEHRKPGCCALVGKIKWVRRPANI